MTRIRDLLISLRAKRVRQMYNNSNDTVSFDAFCNDNSADDLPKIKESSLTVRELRSSRIKVGPTDFVVLYKLLYYYKP